MLPVRVYTTAEVNNADDLQLGHDTTYSGSLVDQLGHF